MANAKIIQEKQEAVDVVAKKLTSSASTIVVDYRGLNVAQVTELRKQLRDAGVEFQVLKNSIVSRATEGTDFAALKEVLSGPTAVAFSAEDAIAPAKILYNFAKTNEALTLKGGIVDGKVINESEVKALAQLPSREGLLSMLLSVLQAPVRNFALAVKAVADKQEA